MTASDQDASPPSCTVADPARPDVPRVVLEWYDRHARDLPWRAQPGAPAPDPYRVWLSEVMLQQTTVAAVKSYFAAFTERWPTVTDLAAAEPEAVMAAWAGLGYYARARNLHACARAVAAAGGQFPRTEAALRALPGLGAYTAASVAAIAFGERAVVIDANVERVVARLFAIDTPLPAARRAIREAAERITPDERAGDFAQAMMDLGATVCTAKAPRCLLCPLASTCRARVLGLAATLPVKAARKLRPARRGRAFWIERDGAVWLVTRAGRGMLGGMRALPDDGWTAGRDGTGVAPFPGAWQDRGAVTHGFTHCELTLSLAYTTLSAGNPPGDGEWCPIERIGAAGLPTLFARAAQRVLADRATAPVPAERD